MQSERGVNTKPASIKYSSVTVQRRGLRIHLPPEEEIARYSVAPSYILLDKYVRGIARTKTCEISREGEVLFRGGDSGRKKITEAGG